MRTNVVIDDPLMAEALDALLGHTPPAVGDLMLAKVLQGCPSQRVFGPVRRMLAGLECVVVLGGAGGQQVPQPAIPRPDIAKDDRHPIATRCIVGGCELLHDGRDFVAFERLPGCVASVRSVATPALSSAS